METWIRTDRGISVFQMHPSIKCWCSILWRINQCISHVYQMVKFKFHDVFCCPALDFINHTSVCHAIQMSGLGDLVLSGQRAFLITFRWQRCRQLAFQKLVKAHQVLCYPYGLFLWCLIDVFFHDFVGPTV